MHTISKVAFLLLYMLLAFLLSAVSACLCALGEVKVKIVLVMSVLIFLWGLVRPFIAGKSAGNQNEMAPPG